MQSFQYRSSRLSPEQEKPAVRNISPSQLPANQASLHFPPDERPYTLFCTTEHAQKQDSTYSKTVSMASLAIRREKRVWLLRKNIKRLSYRFHDADGGLEKSAKALRKQIRYAANYEQMLEHTGAYLQKVASSNREGAYPIVSNALYLMDQSPNKSIDEICQELRVSGRQLRRIFREQAGMSPKYFLRIVRLHRAATMVLTANVTDFQQIIHECGYYDQSHFAKDIKLFTGKRPKEFFSKDA